jgi:ElaB/YqjD/DUF883 family membrane-anchored ribosome-binding protein
MSNVVNILDARTNKNFQAFSEGLDKTRRSTIADADRTDPRVTHVLDSLFDVLESKTETAVNLIEKLRTASEEEFVAIQKQLDASPRLVMEAFFAKVNATSDVEDPVVLAAFKAAGQYLVEFLQLENELMSNDLDMFITHVQLRSDRQPPKTRRRSRSKQKETEGTR